MSDLLEQATGDQTQVKAEGETTNTRTETQEVDLLSELVGDGKRYKDQSALAKSRIEADNHIKQIEAENAEMRDAMRELESKANKNIALTDILEEVRKSSATAGDNQAPAEQQDVALILEDLLMKREKQATAQQNRDAVNNAIRAKFDDEAKAVEFLRSRQKELGLDKNTVDQLSTSSPTAFLKLMGIDSNPTQVPSTSAYTDNVVNSDAMFNRSSGVKNIHYYNDLRKKMGFSNFFADKALQREKQQMAAELGAKFFE